SGCIRLSRLPRAVRGRWESGRAEPGAADRPRDTRWCAPSRPSRVSRLLNWSFGLIGEQRMREPDESLGQLAQAEAAALGDEYVGTHHLLLAVANSAGTVAVAA